MLNKTIIISLAALVGLIAQPLQAQQANRAETTKKLTEVQKQIAQQKVVISDVSKQRLALEETLKADDIAIAKSARAINETAKELTKVQSKLTELNSEKRELNEQKSAQESLLASQLRSAYSNGDHDYLKLLFNQEKPSEIARTMSYYQYLNEARVNEITAFQQTIADLLKVTTEVIEQESELVALKKSQGQQRIKLQDAKISRQKTYRSLEQELQSNQQRLAQLEAEETNLVAALRKLAEIARNAVQASGLSKLKRQLYWPVKGRISRTFGSKKQGYLKWKGVIINARQGQEVRTIHAGTVLFADWLKGYGFVTVVDHGKGYMSLYGHNQTLLKNVGDRVETGEPIALVGQSGGQQQSGVYFEIRHNGKAVNPKIYCR
ncbi:murein hydrolase activator EnvC family protein [Thalassotalea agarivorans]|uniref:Septal ring factor EnvC, activator of murein hydrolases AmiA and AmiB n=1 Tax=Thalassotalea agarivorans TaxID=349064 RepID=A0A1I0HQE9_THASX|nr:peptidoglycan DD-metalloendopeptidase family protein [Thalassotalea agarivorans]SET86251.1 Septal ring factor EnvC, activator of murein hydrolases AmiA and AmiB [Thalassotalea agarivorans]